MEPREQATRREGTHLLVRAGEYACALPLPAVRRVVRALTVHPLPGAMGELEGLAGGGVACPGPPRAGGGGGVEGGGGVGGGPRGGSPPPPAWSPPPRAPTPP